MESRARYTLVGSVVMGMLIVAAVTLWWATRSDERSEGRLYAIFFRNYSLSGLQVNSDVTMRGIRVGSVANLQILPHDIESIRVLVRLQAETPVKTDTEAVVQRNLLTGLAYIDLIHTTSKAAALEAAPGQLYPTIPEGETTLGALQENLPQMVDRLGMLIENLNAVLSEPNREALSRTLSNVERLTTTLADQRSDLALILQESRTLVQETKALVQQLNSRSEQLSRSLSGEAGRIAESITAASHALSATLQEYENPRSLVAGTAQPPAGPGEN